ncbi:TPA: recombinase family protein [Vibrio vulnificus]|uniref:recombinase family protein n=1 Tax=Vibrio parahaemolyticus TaxID=670 RepID=UPI00146CBFC3|nr:recombinase family protein [Vibrio parahaemolyticus]HDY7685531.1 recombinase family protein [Vibrio vulnificus]MDF5123323.1 recombinase family protein [Vibrio parahaemolyticus]MDF5682047.1 recombinase family protein [Vibrio parahaemolyticus]NMT58473.1 recombinase family protein [Vibrio parahaemolyticus]NMU08949.1 recombinase family protein [Vibrio parahaemolyticus]
MIYGYLRASTSEQDATRAKTYLERFASEHKVTVAEYFIENASGRDFDRPILNQLIDIAEDGDTILVEQLDRLTRLSSEDWEKLKNKLVQSGVSIVAVDIPTSYQLLKKDDSIGDELTNIIFKKLNELLFDVLAAIAAKDYEDRRRRQAEGINKAKKEGKYRGKQQTQETVEKCLKANQYIESNGLSQLKACQLAGVSISTWRRFNKSNRPN